MANTIQISNKPNIIRLTYSDGNFFVIAKKNIKYIDFDTNYLKFIFIDGTTLNLDFKSITKPVTSNKYQILAFVEQMLDVSNYSLWQTLSEKGYGFSAITGFVTISGTNETPFCLLKNPANSGILVRLKEFFLTASGTTAQGSIFRFYRSPQVTNNGTAIGIQKVLATSSITSVVQAFQSPTVSNNGELITLFEVGFDTLCRDQDLGRYLPSGGDLLVTVQGTNTNLEHNVTGVWAEEPNLVNGN